MPPPRVLLPVLWPLAVIWALLEAVGRGIVRLHDGYVAGADRLGRALAEMGRAVLRALGPVGRMLLRLVRPVLRVLRLAWDQLGWRVFLFLVRPVGRFARWVTGWSRPAAERLIAWGRRVGEVLEPATRVLVRLIAAVERRAAWVGQFLRRAAQPVRRAGAAVRSTLRRRA